MPIRPPTHRAAGQARRTALLEAAVEVIAVGGVTAATHRAIATKAQVPLSTTSYFFASIDELVAEAMDMMVTQLLARIDTVAAEIADQSLGTDEMVERYVDLLLDVPQSFLAAVFTIYAQCPYRPQIQELAHRMMAAFEAAAEKVLRIAGAKDPGEGARAVVALVDGFALQRFAWPRGDDDRAPLACGLRALFHAYIS
ncbi:TetR/AcrR family transcriptional regulator [Nocardia sp. NPDC052566]|uniref:TetR/AcrR family transcriptional regulator n=1 Tax=Nocardia sp. NPDC052566 TaxID=3364330 RepID=UPI0037C9EFD0